jgi:quinol-cytochrome oxidoreductase complex cytochrome b subunit
LAYIPGIGDSMVTLVRGSSDVSSATLLNFYNFHTGILPLLMGFFMTWHFWAVRKAKGVAIPTGAKDHRVSTYPNFVLKEMVVGLILIAVIFLLSALFSAPLLERANPSYSPNPAKAPWYFMGIQELLLHIHPFFASLVIPLFFFGGLIWLPYAIKSGNSGVWFHSEKGKRIAIQTAVLTLILTPLAILLEEYLLNFEDWLPGWPKAISEGLIPFILLIASFAVYVLLIRKKYKAEIHEIVVGLFTIFIVAYLILSIIGIWFRGEGMVLTVPW